MSDPEPPSLPPAPESTTPPRLPRRCNWQRVRIYFWAAALALSLWPLGMAYTLREDPKHFIDGAFAQFPFPATVGQVRWTNADTLELSNVRCGDFFFAYRITLSASMRDLWRRHLDSVQVAGGDLYMANLTRYLASSQGKSTEGLDWTIRKLILRRGVVLLDLGPALPAVPVNVGLLRPVILNHVHLGTPDNSAPMTEERVLELENIHFSSPFDPLAPVLGLPLVRVKFTYAEIWHHQIRGIDLVRPDLYLGQDLFWFTDQFKRERSAAAKTGPQSPWKVGHFGVEYGRLSINTFGQPRFTFPFFFDTQVDDIQLDQLDKLSAKSVIAIRDFTKNYPQYKINIVDLHGKLEFSVPPTNAKANNVVPTVFIKEVAWNGIPVTNAWATATFDPTGIYARLGGTCEKGLMEGNLEVYYTKGFEWNANFFAHQIDAAPIAEKLAGKYGSLTGVIEGKISVQGKATTINRVNGGLTLDQPGALKIQSVDRLVNDLPASMTGFKRDALKVALQAFTYYPYTQGQFLVDYQPGDGGATLKLNGPVGRRDFSIYWHPFGRSEVAKDGDTH
jgi:hypothetical protein